MLLLSFVRAIFVVLAAVALGMLGVTGLSLAICAVPILTLAFLSNQIIEDWLVERFN